MYEPLNLSEPKINTQIIFININYSTTEWVSKDNLPLPKCH